LSGGGGTGFTPRALVMWVSAIGGAKKKKQNPGLSGNLIPRGGGGATDGGGGLTPGGPGGPGGGGGGGGGGGNPGPGGPTGGGAEAWGRGEGKGGGEVCREQGALAGRGGGGGGGGTGLGGGFGGGPPISPPLFRGGGPLPWVHRGGGETPPGEGRGGGGGKITAWGGFRGGAHSCWGRGGKGLPIREGLGGTKPGGVFFGLPGGFTVHFWCSPATETGGGAAGGPAHRPDSNLKGSSGGLGGTPGEKGAELFFRGG